MRIAERSEACPFCQRPSSRRQPSHARRRGSGAAMLVFRGGHVSVQGSRGNAERPPELRAAPPSSFSRFPRAPPAAMEAWAASRRTVSPAGPAPRRHAGNPYVSDGVCACVRACGVLSVPCLRVCDVSGPLPLSAHSTSCCMFLTRWDRV